MAVGEFDAALSSQGSLSLAENFGNRQGLLVCFQMLGVGEVSMVGDEFVDSHGRGRRRRGRNWGAFIFDIGTFAVELPSFGGPEKV